MLQDLLHMLVILKRTLEHVQRTVVDVVHEVLKVVFEGHADLVPFVVLTDLELCLLVLTVEVVKGPVLVNLPLGGASCVGREVP
jgi:hypothetical protein